MANNVTKEFKAKFKADHPKAKIRMIKGFRTVQYPTGLIETVGVFEASQQGYKPKQYRVCIPHNGERWYTVQ